jgi:two-component system OmpR family sensor kinase/two-component system sensor histidine kinase BaeS
MRLRLFWTMLLAFSMVIVLGIGGMLTFFGLAMIGAWQPSQYRAVMLDAQRAAAMGLGDYYTARGRSWDGVQQRLEIVPFGVQPGGFAYVLVDQEGRVIASDDPAQPVGRPVSPARLTGGTPIEVDGARVGTLFLRSGFDFGPGAFESERQPQDLGWHFGRAFMSAGLALTGVLFGLAVVFAGWLSRPIRRITEGARQLAAGKLDVQVRGAAIRELDDLAQSFNAMAQALNNADRQRRQMTADIAHELRTPLTVIKGRLEGMQDGIYQATPDQVARLLDETALLGRLIEDLRLLALADAGQLPLYLAPVAPRDLLEHAAAALADAARAQHVIVCVDAPDDLPTVSVDPQRMSQVLGNLLGNALRHMPADGAITLAARVITGGRQEQMVLRQGVSGADHDSFVELTVTDTGSGIAPDDLPYIFDRFWRADRSRTRSSGGTGLGLAIARQIVVAHGGAITADSTPGTGTTMTIRLPADLNGRDLEDSPHPHRA